jgi:hypothetical protein
MPAESGYRQENAQSFEFGLVITDRFGIAAKPATFPAHF